MREAWGAACLPFFVAASVFKASPFMGWLPLDFTLALALLVSIAATDALLQGKAEIRRSVGWLLAAFGIAGLGMFAMPDTVYAHSKTLALVTLTLGCAMGGGLLLVRNRTQRKVYLYSTALAGLAVAVLVLVDPPADNSLGGRLAIEGLSTIAPGRHAGAALVVVVVASLNRSLRLLYAVPLIGLLVAVTLATGSRGPLIAVAVAVLGLVPIVRSQQRARSFIVLGAIAGFAWYTFNRADAAVQQRIALLLAEDQGNSVSVRQQVWDVSLDLVERHPFGLGWGGMAPTLFPLRYPHNVVLEVAGEVGWIGALALLALIVVAIKRALRLHRGGDATALAMLALLLFWLTNALVSGDVNDNRGLFVLLGACLAMPGVPALKRYRRLEGSSRGRPS